MVIDRKLAKNCDYLLPAIVGFLVVFGLIAVYSATHNLVEARGDSLFFVKRQAAWAVVGLAAMLGVMAVDYRELGKLSRLLYYGTLVLLVGVLFLGPTIGGAERWLILGPIRLQPAEFAKLAVIITLAKHLEGHTDLHTWRGLIAPFLHVALPVVLILQQPDLGTALVFLGILMGMLFVAGARPLHLGLISLGGLVATIAAIVVSRMQILPILKEYQIQRLLVFIDPYQYQYEEGWNVIQSMIAIGSGQFFGKGLFGGSQTQLNFLPARHTDFIFSVVGEEFGFLGSLLLLALYFLLLWRTLQMIPQAKDAFGTLLITGVTSMLAFHLAINVGMTVGLMPVTGLPLPFLSYGGSSLMTNFIGIGILLSVYMRRQKIRFGAQGTI